MSMRCRCDVDAMSCRNAALAALTKYERESSRQV
jgi:hypothetical protein